MSTAAEAAAATPPAKKGGMIKIILAVVVSAAAAGGGATFMAAKKAPAAPAAEGEEAPAEHAQSAKADEHGSGHGEEGKVAPAGDYFPLTPTFVVNLNDDEAMRFLQIDVEVMARKSAAIDTVKAELPLIRNRLMLLFSAQKYHDLLPREGKEKLQAAAADEINKVLDERKKPHINALVFTSLVMQ